MKKYCNLSLRVLCLLLLYQTGFVSADCNDRCAISACQTDSKTFFRSRSIIEDVSFFLGLNQYNYYRGYFEPGDCEPENERVHIAVGGFFEKSNPSAKNRVGRFFFPRSTASTDETTTTDTVSSILFIKPERKVAGGYLDYHQDFCFCDGLWLDVKFALYQATHNLHAKEKDLSVEVTDTECTPLRFLMSNQLDFGRISTAALNTSGFDDIEVKLGYLFFNCQENGYLGLYASALLPIADKPTAQFLFEPLVGRGHWGAGVGLNAARSLYSCENMALTLLTDFSYQYLFKGAELRSLDLNIGQLSRYMVATNATNTGLAVPAINLTTLNVEVTPRGVINFWLAPHLQYCNWHAEVGYNLWWRQSEKICFCDCQSNNFDNLGVFLEDFTFVPLTLDNLNLASTSHPKTLTNKIYVALSCDTQACCRPFNIGLSGSYEFSRNINSMEQWGIWANIETDF